MTSVRLWLPGSTESVIATTFAASTALLYFDNEGDPIETSPVSDLAELRQTQNRLRSALERYRSLFDEAPVGYLVLDEHGLIRRASQTALQLFDCDRAALEGRPLSDFCTLDSEEQLAAHLQECRSGVGQRCRTEIRLRRGQYAPLHVRLETVRVGADEEGPLRAALIDLTDQRALEARLTLAASVVEHTSEGVMITDAERRIVAVNPAFTTITGYSAKEVIGKIPRVLRDHPTPSEHLRRIREQLATMGRWQGEIWNRRKDGERYPEWLSINEIRDDAGDLTHYVGIFSDISSQQRVKTQLHHLAYYDSLTGLSNRQHFLDQLRSVLFSVRRGDSGLIGLLYLDLDRFKEINDSLGHSVGDRLLCFVANLLRDCVRKSDTVARLGGDEFTVILAQLNRSEDAATVAGKILRGLQAIPFTHEGTELFIGASIGISLYPEDARDSDGLLRCADMAMYRAKESGRNGYRFYAASMSVRYEDRLQLEADLRRAVAHGELSLLYQPQVRLADGCIVGCEALLRWQNEVRGQVSPDRFIPLAEDSGLIVPLGQWVLNESLKQLHRWRAHIGRNFRLAINVSGAQLRSMHVDRLLNRLLEAPVSDRRRLEIELTESVLMDQPDRVTEILGRLKSLGLGIAVDDFGTGYSSLNYLKRFPIDRLKIDASFVQDVESDPSDAAIAATIIAMGNALGLQTVAEGIETPGQLAFLSVKGCDEAQGFLFSRPLDAEAMFQALASGGSLLPEAPLGNGERAARLSGRRWLGSLRSRLRRGSTKRVQLTRRRDQE